MTRETKVGLLIGTAVVLLIGIIVSDHLAVVQDQEPADLTAIFGITQQPTDLPTDSSAAAPVDALPDVGAGRRPMGGGSNLAADRRQTPLPIDLGGSITPPRPVEPTRPTEPPKVLTQRYQMARATNLLIPSLSQTEPGRSTGETAVVAESKIQAKTARGVEAKPVARRRVATSSPAPKPYVHHVQPGETLWEISERYYHRGEDWRRIADANPGSVMANGQVRRGVRLVVPRVDSKPAGQPEAARRKPAVKASKTNVVRVQKGETLIEIAERHLGSSDRWRELYEANRGTIANPDVLHEGMQLRLPGSRPVSSAPASRTRKEPKRETPSRYRVRPGDTLASVAQKTLGDQARWPDVYRANRDRIDDPNDIWVGLELVIPG